MNKKVISSLLASVMALSTLSMTVLADAGKTGENTIKVNTSFTAPTLTVTIPAAIGVAINPYHLEVELSATETTGTDGLSSPEYEIKNDDTTMGVVVKAYAWGKGKGVELLTTNAKTGAKPELSATDKQAFAFLNTSKTSDDYDSDAYDPESDAQLAFSDSKQETSKELQKLDVSESCFFQVQGDVTEDPEKAWTKDDVLDLNLIFDLKPYNPNYGGDDNQGGGFTPVVAFDSAASTLTNVTYKDGVFTVKEDDAANTGDTYTIQLVDTNGAAIKKDGQTADVTVKAGTDDDSIIGSIANNGKITISLTGNDGTYTATITLTDTASSKTQDYTIKLIEAGN